jgi:COMPASS component SWD2
MSSCTRLTDELMASLKIAKVFQDNDHHVKNLDFSRCGSVCLTGSQEDESIQLYDALGGKKEKVIFSKKYGVGSVRFTHRPNNVIYSSTKGDDIIRYLSLHDNAYLRYFKGHRTRVVALEMSPLDDTFISGSIDDTVRLWDLRSPNCQGVLNVTGRPLVAIDPQGIVFAVALNSRHIRLFDMKNYEKGPFTVFEIVDPARPDIEWSQLCFSPDGKDLLINTRSDVAYLVDGFDGFVKQVFTGHQNTTQLELEVSFTPDANYVLGASQDGKVHVWSRESGKTIATLEGHSNYPQVVRFNPKYMMMVSACTNTAFWIPEL